MIVVNVNLFSQQAQISLPSGAKVIKDLTTLPADIVDLTYSEKDYDIIILGDLPIEINQDFIDTVTRIEANKFNENKIRIKGAY